MTTMQDDTSVAFSERHRFETTDGDVVRFRRAGPQDGMPALLIHGHAQTEAMWRPAVVPLTQAGYRIVAPDIRVLRPAVDDPPSKADLARIFDALIADQCPHATMRMVVGHDLGAMIAYAHAAQFPERVAALAVMDATPPGIGFWDILLTDPRTWHFGFFGPFAERLVTGRENIYLDRFWCEFSGSGVNPMPVADRTGYLAALREPGALRAALDQFRSFAMDRADNARFAEVPLSMPVLAMGGALSFGPMIAEQMSTVATNVTPHVVPDAGHWLLEENPDDTLRALLTFLDGSRTTRPNHPKT